MRWFMRTSPAVEGGRRCSSLAGAAGAAEGPAPGGAACRARPRPPLSENIKFLSAPSTAGARGRHPRSLVAEPVENGGRTRCRRCSETLLPLAPDERFDAVLAWDVFDYLRKDQVTALMMRLVPRFRRSAQMLVLISMRRQLPAVPVRYRIVDRENLDCEKPPAHGASEPMRPCPQYKQSDLGHMMPGLAVRRCHAAQRDQGIPDGAGLSWRASLPVELAREALALLGAERPRRAPASARPRCARAGDSRSPAAVRASPGTGAARVVAACRAARRSCRTSGSRGRSACSGTRRSAPGSSTSTKPLTFSCHHRNERRSSWREPDERVHARTAGASQQAAQRWQVPPSR